MSKRYSLSAFSKSRVWNRDTRLFEMVTPHLKGHFYLDAEDAVTDAEKFKSVYEKTGSTIDIEILNHDIDEEEEYEPTIEMLYDWICKCVDPEVRRIWTETQWHPMPYNSWIHAWRIAGKPVIW